MLPVAGTARHSQLAGRALTVVVIQNDTIGSYPVDSGCSDKYGGGGVSSGSSGSSFQPLCCQHRPYIAMRATHRI